MLNPETITVLDPACGSGHILVEAYDVLKAIYLERGYRMRDIPRLILEKNLYGLDIDERAAQLAGFALLMKARADDRRLLDNPPKLNVLALQESPKAGFRFEGQGFRGEGLGTSDFDALLPFLGPRPSSLAPNPYNLIPVLLDTFAHAKTFGSLIQIPPDLKAQLATMDAGLQLAIQSGDLLAQAAALNLLPLVRQAKILGMQFDAVVANPPYMGSKGMNAALKDYTKHTFPDSKSDLFAMFIERGFEWCKLSGFNSMVTMQSWMFLSSFETMRERLLSHRTISTMAHLGARAFSEISGEVVQTTAFVAQGQYFSGYKPVFFRLVDGQEEQKKADLRFGQNRFDATIQDDFKKIPGSPVAYWTSNQFFNTFLFDKPIGAVAKFKAGMSTGNNPQFQRYWHEVDFLKTSFDCKSSIDTAFAKWFPCNSGGEFRKWYGNNEIVVDWENNGEQIRSYNGSAIRNSETYFHSGLTYSKLSSGLFAARFKGTGFVYDDTGRSVFCNEEQDIYAILGLLCSKVAHQYLSVMAPTMSFTSTELARIPFLEFDQSVISRNVNLLINFAKADWDTYETSWDFTENPLIRQKQTTRATINNPVIPARMPESSHRDVNLSAVTVAQSSICPDVTLPSMALDSGIPAGMTALSPVGYASRTITSDQCQPEKVRDAHPTRDGVCNPVPNVLMTPLYLNQKTNPADGVTYPVRLDESVTQQTEATDVGLRDKAANPTYTPSNLEQCFNQWQTQNRAANVEMQRLEEENNCLFIEAYSLQDELSPEVQLEQITLNCNPYYRYGVKGGARGEGLGTGDTPLTPNPSTLIPKQRYDAARELLSYAIGCMMGRYRLDKPGLIYAHAGNVDFDKIYNGGDRDEGRGASEMLPRPDCLAESNGVGRACVSNDQSISKRGTLWIEQPDSTGGGVDTLEHRGGTCETEPCRIPEFSIHRTGFESGSGDSNADSSTFRLCKSSPDQGNNVLAGGTVENAQCTENQTNPSTLTPNPFLPDADGIVPITDELWFEDDAANRIDEFLQAAFLGVRDEGLGAREQGLEGNETSATPSPLTPNPSNLQWLAESLGQKGNETPIETIRRYLAGSFFKDHLQTYKKRPIYWLFSSGKQGAFQALVYLHRYHESTLARMRAEYVVPLPGKIQSRIEMLEKDAAVADSNTARNKLNKDIEKLKKKHVELLAYDEKLRHYADQRIQLDLDEGVKVNYGKFGDLLAEVKAVTGGKDE